ncbi:hypothetical protein HYH03_011639 [Edaphochlamys debaryana]|uniref:Uncharacterized protein n=1 Tax=Edaphochlamys debaryana TaxID=47281 RepID=A0A836BUR0_9CHLO|nr:hypothetical protein HYH03_011639 [Edaphochlamys debaryana]|eukprot:KAG2489836.1 hypothetical protein HYH03_011639 [Edaphochlamys debaryana]
MARGSTAWQKSCLAIGCLYALLNAAAAFDECSAWYKQKPDWRTDPLATAYWLAPLNVSRAWTNCGPAAPDVVSQISIVSLDTKRNTRICKIDIRTRGGQSYSVGQHCPFGLPQTLDLFPGERILKVSLAFLDIQKDTYRRNTVTLGSLCIITTYGGVLKSGKASCDTAVTVKEPNSGILAGLGGSTRLDDTGVEYINSLFLIFYPWPDKVIYDLGSYKFLGKEPSQSISVQDECLGNKAFCRLADTDTRATCSMTVERSETFSVTTSDTVTRSFGVANSKSLTQGLTQGKETGTTTQVGLTKTATTGQVMGVSFSASAQEGVEVSEGVTVTKEQTESQEITEGMSTSSHWSDSVSAGTTKSFGRSDSRETTNSREVSNTQERSRGRTMSESSTTGTSDTSSSEIADSQSFETSATRSNEVTNSQENSRTNGHSQSTSGTVSAGLSSTTTIGVQTGFQGGIPGLAETNTQVSAEQSLTASMEASMTQGEEMSSSLTNSQSQAHSQGFQESQGSTRGRTATQGQSRTSSRERTVGSEVSETASESNTMSQGWSQTVGSTVTQEESFSSERTAERGGSTEQSRSVGFGK